MGKRKVVELLKSTPGSLVADGFSGLEELGGELRDWYDALPDGLRDNRSDIDEAASTLESLSEPSEPPAVVGELLVEYKPAGKYDTSRRARRDQITYELSVAIGAAQEWFDDEANAEHEDRDEVESWIEEVQELLDEADGVDFPGMYA